VSILYVDVTKIELIFRDKK